jgi:hypothetical protein
MGREKREKPDCRGRLKNNDRWERNGAARLDKGIESNRDRGKRQNSEDLQQTPEQNRTEQTGKKRANKSLNLIS